MAAGFVDVRLDGAARHVFAGSGFTIGAFDCEPDDWRWRSENWIGSDLHIVFPGTPVWIAPHGDDPVLATTNAVLCYDPDARFRRRLAAREGDHCSYVVVHPELADELGLAPAGSARRRAPTLNQCRAPARLFGRYRTLHAAIDNEGLEPMTVDEAMLGLLGSLVVLMNGPAEHRPSRRRERPAAAAVETVKWRLAAAERQTATLAELAAEVSYSPFHLAREFRRRTGYSIHGFGRHLRLRRSLDDLLDGSRGLAEIAADHGFSSHSHYTRLFTREFGVPPSAVRDGRQVPTT